jgi:hypothetical protein
MAARKAEQAWHIANLDISFKIVVLRENHSTPKKNNRQKNFVVLFHPLSLNRLAVLGIIHGDISSDVESKPAVAH